MSAERSTADNTAMLLIDHQQGTMSQVGPMALEEMKANAISLAKTAKALGIPLILTSSQEENMQGPLMPELEEIAPEEFAAAVKAAGRKNLIIAGVTNDVCTVYPTLTALRQGYQVQVVADAGGSPTRVSDDLSIRRMEIAGAVITSTNSLMAELAGNWTSEHGSKIVAIAMERMNQQ
ncbi:Isochorismatase hydrolase [Streptomyces bingchenggensis BCW-1]|uniref:Isochorismatase hydrolase n=1 Tax=Streptomyces bingchenggensis (strain BCW-1) TaxID=749414 RepID=D7CDX0_STRBB|nr:MULTISPECIES: isochorismatase family protein [Streptomyces]ADI04635.1 Isochorismatase hydrolase [Streptomyces bingchenggensis BCW-1]